MGDVPEVGVTTVNGFFGVGDGDVVLGGVVDGVFTREDVPFAPRGDDFDAGIDGHIGELETDLIVAFAGGTMGDGFGAEVMGGFDLIFGGDGAGDGSAEEVFVFVFGTTAHHGEDEVFG